MPNDAAQRDPVKLGADAERLVADPVLQEAMRRMHAEIVEKWEASEDIDEREHWWRMMRQHRAFRGALKDFINGGKFAAADEKQRVSWFRR